jgi:hypothetical protein
VRYLRAEEGGVSHFRYFRDNVLLTWMHVRLVFGFLLRLPVLLARAAQRSARNLATRSHRADAEDAQDAARTD